MRSYLQTNISEETKEEEGETGCVELLSNVRNKHCERWNLLRYVKGIYNPKCVNVEVS